jgi:hypothetical protein
MRYPAIALIRYLNYANNIAIPAQSWLRWGRHRESAGLERDRLQRRSSKPAAKQMSSPVVAGVAQTSR